MFRICFSTNNMKMQLLNTYTMDVSRIVNEGVREHLCFHVIILQVLKFENLTNSNNPSPQKKKKKQKQKNKKTTKKTKQNKTKINKQTNNNKKPTKTNACRYRCIQSFNIYVLIV